MSTWTAADKALLDQLVADGKDIVTMEQVLGKTKDSIRHKLKRMGVIVTQPPKPPKAEKPPKIVKEKKPRRKKIAVEQDDAKDDIPVPARVYPIDRIGPRGCQWPMGDHPPRHPDFRFCGERREGSGPYCQEHTKRAFGSHPPVRAAE